MNKSMIINKLKEFLGFKTDLQFADYLGIKQSTLSSWRSRNVIDYDLIIAKCVDINANWLMTGEGPMLKNYDDLSFETEPFEYKKTDEFYTALKQVIEDKQKIINMLEEEVARLKQEKAK